MFKVRHHGDIALYTFCITAAMVATIVGVVQLTDEGYLTDEHYAFAMRLAVGLPLAILPPILILVFYILKTITAALDKIESFVKFDALTRTLARAYFLESVRSLFPGGGVLLLIDADHFKSINDRFGHDVGDEALRLLGETLNLSAPEGALVGRLGGEELAIFLPGADAATAERIAALVNENVCDRGQHIAGKQVGLTVSIGASTIVPGSTLTLLFKEADETLYAAKTGGRNRCVLGPSFTAGLPRSLAEAA